MAGSDENSLGVIGLANVQSGGGKFVMGDIDSIVTEAPGCPCAVNKRGCTENQKGSLDKDIYRPMHAVSDKNPPIPVNRWISRKFAAQLANKQQQLSKETTKPLQLVSNPRETEDCTLTDAEDYKTDSKVPMFVQHTESILEEIDQMEEVEMEDIAEEPVIDIESCDKKNPLAVPEYIDDIYAYYKKVENSSCVPPNYMENQSDVNEKMRGILIDWLIEVQRVAVAVFLVFLSLATTTASADAVKAGTSTVTLHPCQDNLRDNIPVNLPLVLGLTSAVIVLTIAVVLYFVCRSCYTQQRSQIVCPVSEDL